MPIGPNRLREEKISADQNELLLGVEAEIDKSLQSGYIGYGTFEYPLPDEISSEPILLEELTWRFYRVGWYVTYVGKPVRVSGSKGLEVATVLIFNSIPPSPKGPRPIR